MGAHWTSWIAIDSRLFKASESRPSTFIRPTRRHSSVIPWNATPVRVARGAELGAVWAGGASDFLRRRKFSGTRPLWPRSILGLEAVLADRLDDGSVGEGRRVAERAALGDVTQEPAHDLAAARLGQVRCEHQRLRFRDRADLRRDVLPELLAQLDGGLVA